MIKNHEQYLVVMNQIETWLQKGFSNLTQTENEMLHQLSMAVAVYESCEHSN